MEIRSGSELAALANHRCSVNREGLPRKIGHGPELIRQLVLENQVMLGSVNAARATLKWPRLIWPRPLLVGALKSLP